MYKSKNRWKSIERTGETVGFAEAGQREFHGAKNNGVGNLQIETLKKHD